MRIPNRIAMLLTFCGLLVFPRAILAGDEYAGKYTGASLAVEILAENAAYTGTIQLGARQFPLKAHTENGSLQGTFSSGGNDFPFTAMLADGTLTLSTGGATYVLKKDAAPVNPLAAPQPINPLAAGGNTGDAPVGYSVVTTTDSGKAITAQKPDATTVLAAMKATFPDLERFFGSRPTVLGAYENQQDHKSGTATFSVSSKGKQLTGLVSCKIGDHGAAVAVVYCSADASPAEWKKLTADAPRDANRAALPQLTQYRFADGTGSIGLADGWTTQAQSCMSVVQIKGPADQAIGIGFCLPVQTPDSPIVQIQQQLAANARQWGMPPPPPPKMFIAPFTDPADALNNLVPQVSQFSQDAGSFALEIDNLKTLPQDVKPCLPGGKAALVTYGVTKTLNGTRTHYLAGARIDITPIGAGAWMFYMTEILAPDKTFEQDAPVMLAMVKSLKVNNEVVAELTRANLDASNQRFEMMQQAHREQMAGFEEQNKAWERRQLQESRSFADFDEVIVGDRTVLDTATGNRSSVDLGNVDAIVNRLNEADPGRYKQIPLRDEMYPLPADQR